MKECGKNTFERLQEANRKTILEDARYAGKKAVLLQVIAALNSANLTWALSCSGGLYFMGLVPEFGDFDIIVSPTEYEKLKEVLTAIGAKLKPTVQKEKFLTKMYQQAAMDGVEFDLFGQFWIRTFESEVKYELKKEDIWTLQY